MEKKLVENDHKGGWDECGNGYLKRRMRTELRELFAAVDAVVKCPEGNPKRTDLMARVIAEAADVGNFAMMMADNNALLVD